MSKDLKDLEVWKQARELRKDISKFCKGLPEYEKFKLVDQLVRASRSVTANIAEGHGRYHYQENIQYCRQARGSLVEMYDHMTVALDELYINEDTFNAFDQKIERVTKMLNGYIAHLKKLKDEK